jgi:hypothetical protein
MLPSDQNSKTKIFSGQGKSYSSYDVSGACQFKYNNNKLPTDFMALFALAARKFSLVLAPNAVNKSRSSSTLCRFRI